MIEKTVLDYLAAQLTAPVMMEIQPNQAAPFVVIERTSGGETNHIKTAMFAVQSYGVSLVKACELNELVKTAMAALPIHVGSVFSCKLNSDYNYTDTTTKRYRYQAVFDVSYL